mmetsp:Transcript_3209/g.3572  ORF Transcript_3209/g.3572 Transcript_3209/m.3572 type:complete len:86 (+) Transcript_3209:46-303(+)
MCPPAYLSFHMWHRAISLQIDPKILVVPLLILISCALLYSLYYNLYCETHKEVLEIAKWHQKESNTQSVELKGSPKLVLESMTVL